MTTDDESEFELTDELLLQYEKVRRTGLTNMNDRTFVQRIASERGWHALVVAIEDGHYGDILMGYDAERGEALLEADREGRLDR